MPRHATVPAESDLLCETCGYVLNGLPPAGNCPECGRPVAESTADDRRAELPWEARKARGGFLDTTFRVTFKPSQFFRGLRTRPTVDRSRSFATLHLLLSTAVISQGIAAHVGWVVLGEATSHRQGWLAVLAWPLVAVAIVLTTRLAARLTAAEAAYRGVRLPLPVVRRALRFHTAHTTAVLVPAGMFMVLAAHRDTPMEPTHYLYTLCAIVVLGAAYLFWTYWIAMRNVMYANR